MQISKKFHSITLYLFQKLVKLVLLKGPNLDNALIYKVLDFT